MTEQVGKVAARTASQLDVESPFEQARPVTPGFPLKAEATQPDVKAKILGLPPRPTVPKPDWERLLKEEMTNYDPVHLSARHVEKLLKQERERCQSGAREYDRTLSEATEARENIASVREEIDQVERQIVEAVKRKEALEHRAAVMHQSIVGEKYSLEFAVGNINAGLYRMKTYLAQEC